MTQDPHVLTQARESLDELCSVLYYRSGKSDYWLYENKRRVEAALDTIEGLVARVRELERKVTHG